MSRRGPEHIAFTVSQKKKKITQYSRFEYNILYVRRYNNRSYSGRAHRYAQTRCFVAKTRKYCTICRGTRTNCADRSTHYNTLIHCARNRYLTPVDARNNTCLYIYTIYISYANFDIKNRWRRTKALVPGETACTSTNGRRRPNGGGGAILRGRDHTGGCRNKSRENGNATRNNKIIKY